MFFHYLKVGIRNLLKNKVFSFINVFGLAVSMSICLVLIMVVFDQMSYDQYNTKRERIYRVITKRLNNNDFVNGFATAPLPIGNALIKRYTGVEKAVRIRRGFGNSWVGFEDNVNIPIGGFFVDPEFLEVFEYELLYGNPVTALQEPFSVVVTEETAARLFTIPNPIGEVIKVGKLGDYKITGVIKDNGQKSHIRFQAVASISSVKKLEQDDIPGGSIESWESTTLGWVYLLLDKDKSINNIQDHIAEINKHQYRDDEEHAYKFTLQSLTGINPGPFLGNQIGPGMPLLFVYFLAGLALLIMVSACFNYANLSIARSLTRAKEVGIRKVSGAKRYQVITQFLSEAVLISLLSLFCSMLLLVVLKPSFQQLNISQLLKLDLASNIEVYLVFFAFSLLVGILAGFFPAMFLSKFKPVNTFKNVGSIKLFSKVGLRKSLIVMQFILTLIFIITASLIKNQLNHMVNADFGFDASDIINLRLNGAPAEQLKHEIEKYDGVINVTATSHIPATGISRDGEFTLALGEEPVNMSYFSVDQDYLTNLNLKLVAGRVFPPNSSNQREQFIIINERGVKQFNFDSPLEAIGQPLFTDDSVQLVIIGVVQDYYHRALTMEGSPMALRFLPDDYSQLQVKIRPENQENTRANIEAAWEVIMPGQKISYKYLISEIKEFYVMLFGDLIQIISLVSFLAIAISCLGLLGMVIFSIETRIKEVSIRKILGAELSSILILLSKGFIKLILLSIILAVPIAYLVNNLWLQSIAYRVSIDFWMLFTGSGIILLLSLVTILSQTFKVAITNPADLIKSE